jgi:transcriptional accessory protein Tex/SPT6
VVRYRGDVTGGLDEHAVRAVQGVLEDWAALRARKEAVLTKLCGKHVDVARAVRGTSVLCNAEAEYGAQYRLGRLHVARKPERAPDFVPGP